MSYGFEMAASKLEQRNLSRPIPTVRVLTERHSSYGLQNTKHWERLIRRVPIEYWDTVSFQSSAPCSSIVGRLTEWVNFLDRDGPIHDRFIFRLRILCSHPIENADALFV